MGRFDRLPAVAPEEAHETCRRRMEALDREPREVRDRVNEFGH
jgi:hypothetical protein